MKWFTKSGSFDMSRICEPHFTQGAYNLWTHCACNFVGIGAVPTHLGVRK
jgi:hypothetical protein